MQKKWADAVDLVLSKRDNAFGKFWCKEETLIVLIFFSCFFHPLAHLEKCYEVWAATKDPSQALEAIPAGKRDTCIEGILLKALKKVASKDFSSAIRAVSL